MMILNTKTYQATRGISTEIKFQQLIPIPKNLNTNIDSVTGTIQLSNAFGSVSIPIKLSNTINLYTYDSPYKDNKGTVEYFVDEEYRVFTKSNQLIIKPGIGLLYPENSSDTHVFARKFISKVNEEKFGGTFIFEGLKLHDFNLTNTDFILSPRFDTSDNYQSIKYDYIPNLNNQITMLNTIKQDTDDIELSTEIASLNVKHGLKIDAFENENGDTVVSWVFEAPFESNMANYEEAGRNGIILIIKTKNKDFKLTKITLLNTSTGLEW